MTASSKNALRLPPPDLQADGVEELLQAEDVGRVEAATEIARRGGIGNAAGPQGVEVGLVAAEQFQVFQARSPGQQIVGDVQHVVGIVVGQMDFQQTEVTVDRPIETELPHQQVDRADPPVGGGPRAVGNLVVDVGGGQDRPVASPVVVLSSRRAIRRLHLSICFRILVFTRKPPCVGVMDFVHTH